MSSEQLPNPNFRETLYSKIVHGNLVESDAIEVVKFLKMDINEANLDMVKDWINGIPSEHSQKIAELLGSPAMDYVSTDETVD
jgi:hypothetical protein